MRSSAGWVPSLRRVTAPLLVVGAIVVAIVVVLLPLTRSYDLDVFLRAGYAAVHAQQVYPLAYVSVRYRGAGQEPPLPGHTWGISVIRSGENCVIADRAAAPGLHAILHQCPPHRQSLPRSCATVVGPAGEQPAATATKPPD
jgi:hypothetical protein